MVAQKYPNGYSGSRRIQNTETFSRWLRSLRDTRGKARVLMRLKALQFGHLGDCRSLGGGLHELRIFVGPGYRIYLAYRHEAVVPVCVRLTPCGETANSSANSERDCLKPVVSVLAMLFAVTLRSFCEALMPLSATPNDMLGS